MCCTHPLVILKERHCSISLSSTLRSVKTMVYDLQEGSIPRFYSLRRIPRECSSILPLEVMKRYQCVVVGLTGRTLTLAITHPRYLFLCKVISKLTGYTVF